jgi:acetyltransferase-like isoleucine patch superfamily enzyme
LVYYNEQLYGKDVVDKNKDFFNKRVAIHNDVWIGANVFIKNGITVGNGAIIGAGAVVLTDVPEYCIAVGVPAKIIRKRFDDATIQKVKNSKWWENTLEELIAAKDNTDIKTLRELGS